MGFNAHGHRHSITVQDGDQSIIVESLDKLKELGMSEELSEEVRSDIKINFSAPAESMMLI